MPSMGVMLLTFSRTPKVIFLSIPLEKSVYVMVCVVVQIIHMFPLPCDTCDFAYLFYEGFA